MKVSEVEINIASALAGQGNLILVKKKKKAFVFYLKILLTSALEDHEVTNVLTFYPLYVMRKEFLFDILLLRCIQGLKFTLLLNNTMQISSLITYVNYTTPFEIEPIIICPVGIFFPC